MKFFPAFVFLVLSIAAQAQVNYVSFGVSGSNSQMAANVLYHDGWRLGKKEKFEIGIGIRISSYFGTNKTFTSAPPEIAGSDSLFIQTPQVTMINLMLGLNYHVSPKWQCGFNIDLLGGSMGTKKTTTYIQNGNGTAIGALPTFLNLLLIGDNDKGSLNSEFFVRYQLKPTMALQFGLQHMFVEYTTELPIQNYPITNARFRQKTNLFSAGIVYYL